MRRAVDGKERRRIVHELDRTFLVEAGAGSGKTRSLVDRMIACLREGVCGIETLAAVTFTRKAAAELRERFQTGLERAYVDAEGKERERRRLGEALNLLEQCFIGTIHSFCARLLRERPIEIALMPDFREMDDIEDAVYREKCWLDYLVEVRRESPPELVALEEVGLEPEDLKDAFRVIAQYPEVEIVEGRAEAPEFEGIRRKLIAFLGKMRETVPFKSQEETRDDFQTRMARLFVREKNIGFENPLVLMETVEEMNKGFSITQKLWESGEKAKAAKADFEDFKADVAQPALVDWREYRHSRIIDFLRPAVKFYYLQRKKHSLVNFADLLLSVARLLRENLRVREYFQRKFTHILVDEFQDTDPVQAEILMYLTGTDPGERDWRKLSPRAGALFLVGDPKQSIYRFRRADIDTYNVVRDQILDSGGDVLQLTSNFRSLDSLAGWNNPLFERIFPGEADRYQAPFAPMNTVREDEDEAVSGIYKITVGKKARNRGDLIAREDSAAVADWIKWACDGNVRLSRTEEDAALGKGQAAVASDFLLLFRYKKLMEIYARALEERGIPYEITGSDAFADSADIGEIVNLVRALREPDNPVWTAAVLRGIFFGASDEALLGYKREGGRFSYLGVNEGFKSQGAIYIAGCLMTLGLWWRWTKEFTVSTALEMIFEDSGIISYLASSEMGSSKAGNVLKLLELVRGREKDGVTSFSDLVEYMEELVDVHEVEEMSLTPGRADAVRLMNLHKAKGLEAPVVFLCNPVGVRSYEPDKHVVRLKEGGPKGYFLFQKERYFGKDVLSRPHGWEDAAREEAFYEEAEEERLMYVAATRAKNMLVVSTYGGKLTNRAWKLLDDNLGNVEELSIPEPGATVSKEVVEISESDYRASLAAMDERLVRSAEPSYLIESVTSLAKGDETLPEWSRSGMGMSWGRAVHHVLDVVGRDGDVDLELLARNALAAEGRDLGEKWRLVDLIEAMRSSELWQRMVRAEEKYFEIPFSFKIDPADLGRKDSLFSDLGIDGATFKELAGGISGDKKSVFEKTIDAASLSRTRSAARPRLHKGLRIVAVQHIETDGDDSPLDSGRKGTEPKAGIPEKEKLGGKDRAGNEENGKSQTETFAGGKVEFSGNKESRDIPIILSGVIDLVFREGDGWVIADYKTDDIGSGQSLRPFIDYYAPQVKIYARYWERITGQPVKEIGLFFTSINTYTTL